jgi:Bor protein
MIKNLLKLMTVLFFASILFTSCFSYTTVVGTGAQTQEEITEWNHYMIYGLARVNISDAKQMAGGAENYTVHTRQSFLNGIISALTIGIYTPTTTTVTK